MTRIPYKLFILFMISVFVTACLPGEKRASNRQTRITQSSVEEITAASMSQTLENELARIQVLVQQRFDEGGITSETAYALVTGEFAPTESDTVGVGLCPNNTGMFAFLKKDKINGLGNLSDGATTEKIRSALVDRYGADSVGYYRGGEAVGVPTVCEGAVASAAGISENSPVVVLEAQIVADSQTTHQYSNYEYRTVNCNAGETGIKIERREVQRRMQVEGEGEVLSEGGWELISDTCAPPKAEKESIIEWSLRDGANTDWLKKLQEHAIDPRKQVMCDNKTGHCEQVTPGEAEKRIIECSAVRDDGDLITNPLVANNVEQLKTATGCATVGLVWERDDMRHYSLGNCEEPLVNNCAAETVGLNVFQLIDDEGDCMKSCGKGWFGDVNSNYQYRECTVSEIDENGHTTEVSSAKTIYNFYNSSALCEKKDYRETNVTCNVADSIASAGEMEVKLKGEIKVPLDDNGNIPAVLKQATTEEEFDQLARLYGFAKDTGTMTSCNAGENTCKTMSDVDILAIVVDRSASMKAPISFVRKPQIASCSGKIENIFKENNVQELCENLDFKLAVDALVKQLDRSINDMQSLVYYCGDSFGDGGYYDDDPYYIPMSMTVNPAEKGKRYQPAVFYTGDNYNPNWAYRPVYEMPGEGQDNCPGSYSASQIKRAIDDVNDELKSVYLAYDKYSPNVSESYVEALTGLLHLGGGGLRDMAPYNQNPTSWLEYFERMKGTAQAIINKEVTFLKQGVVSSVDKDLIEKVKQSCSMTVTNGILGVCYPPSALGGGPQQSCQKTCLGQCEFATEEQPIGNRNDLVNIILKNTAVRYAPAKKDNGDAIPVLITEFWGTGLTHMVIGFNANGEMEQTILPATLGLGPLGAAVLGNPYEEEYFSTTSNGRLNTYLQPFGNVLKSYPEKVKGPGCLDDFWWDYFLHDLKDADGKLYFGGSETKMKEEGLWRKCPTNREEFMAFMDENPPIANGGRTNLYQGIERTMAWVTNLTRNNSSLKDFLSGADASGVQKNRIPGRLIIFSDGVDNVGREKFIATMEMSDSQEKAVYPAEQAFKIAETPPSITYPNDSIEGYVLKYFPQFSIDFMALEGTIKEEAEKSVSDYNGDKRSTIKVDSETGDPVPVAWRYALLENDDDEAAFMSLVDTDSSSGMMPDLMCDKLYDAGFAGGLIIDPDVNDKEEFKYLNPYQGDHQDADKMCKTDTLYSRPYGGSASGIGAYIPYPAGVGTSSGGGSTPTQPPNYPEPEDPRFPIITPDI